MRTALLFALMAVVLAGPCRLGHADPAGVPCPELTPANQWDPGYSAPLDTGSRPASRKTRALLLLRREGLLLKKQDGGILSEAHRASLQADLDAIQRGRY